MLPPLTLCPQCLRSGDSCAQQVQTAPECRHGLESATMGGAESALRVSASAFKIEHDANFLNNEDKTFPLTENY